MRAVAGTIIALLSVAGAGGSARRAPATAPAAGTITGRVTLTTAVRGAPLASNVYQPRAVGKHEPARTPEIQNVVVYLKDVPASSAPAPLRRAIEQRNEAFLPRVLAVTRGSVVAFPNGDPYFHNVFSLSRAATFDLGRFRQGQSREQRFNKAGLVKVYCHIHSHMSATILVLDHPHFTVPNPDGTFTLAGVPPGRVSIVGWHERVGERVADVEVRPGVTASVDLSLPVEDDR
jgi:plastocyanin